MDETLKRGSNTVIALVVATLSGLLGGCHTLATVVDTSGVRYTGEVVGGTEGTVELRGASGRSYVFSERTIASIAWPGTAAMYTGGSFMLAGLISLVASAGVAASGQLSDELVLVGVGAAATSFLVGLGPLIWGVATMNDAMDRSQQPSAAMTAAPFIAVGHESGSGGLRVSW